MTLLITISILIVLAVLLVTIWTTVKAYNVKHTIDPPQEPVLIQKINDCVNARLQTDCWQHRRHRLGLLRSACYAVFLL